MANGPRCHTHTWNLPIEKNTLICIYLHTSILHKTTFHYFDEHQTDKFASSRAFATHHPVLLPYVVYLLSPAFFSPVLRSTSLLCFGSTRHIFYRCSIRSTHVSSFSSLSPSLSPLPPYLLPSLPTPLDDCTPPLSLCLYPHHLIKVHLRTPVQDEKW